MQPGDVIDGRYRVEQLVARGGMGEVARAVDQDDGRVVAVKTVRFDHEVLRARFRREAAILARVRHPRVVEYLGEGRFGDLDYLVMAWLDGEDLRTRAARAPLRLHEALTLVARVADGLGHVHSLGIVHRDVKPSNVFLRHGEVRDPILLDFGVARDEALSESLTAVDALVGTPQFMAPEQARGERVSPATDVFALGCLLHYLVAGSAPFAADDPVATLARLLFEEAPSLSRRRSGAPRELDELLAEVLAKDPARRPRDAARFADALAQLEIADLAPPSRGGVEGSATALVPRLLSVVVESHGRFDDTVAPDEAHALALLERDFSARRVRSAEGRDLYVVTGVQVATDLAERAVSSALSIVARRGGSRAAVCTGLGDARLFALSELLVRADRLAANALEGEVVVDAPTESLVRRRFVIERDGKAPRVRGERSLDDSPRVLGRTTPFVGRRRELALLQGIADDCVEERSPRVVLLLGEPGIGKSRVRFELVATLTAFERHVVRADPVGGRLAMGLARRITRSLLEPALGGGVEALAHYLESRGVEAPLPTAEGVHELLGLAIARPSDALVAARLEPRLARELLEHTFLRLLCGFSSTPLAVVLEDLQWSDHASLRLLDRAVGELEAPLFVLGIGRLSTQGAFPGLFDKRAKTELRLPPLSRTAIRVLLDTLLPEVDHATRERIEELSEGNAFYLEELVREAAHGGEVGRSEGVLSMVQGRIDALGGEAHATVLRAAVMGPVFHRGALEAMLPPSTVAAGLAELRRTELAAPRASSRFPEDEEWIVRSELVTAAAYRTLSEADRVHAHARVGHWLVAVGETELLAIAEHFVRGHEPGPAVHWLTAAAEQALDANDLDGALQLVDQAETLSPTERDGLSLGLLRIELQRLRGDFGAVVQAAEAVRVQVAEGAEPWIHAVAEQVASGLRLGRRGDAVAAVHHLRAHHGPAGDAAILAVARAASGLAAVGEGALAAALLADLAPSGTAVVRASRAGVAALLALTSEGDLRAYRARSLDAVEAFTAASDRRGACTQRINAGYAAIRLGRIVEARTHLERAAEEAEGLGLHHLGAAAVHNLGLVLLRLGDVAGSIALQRRALSSLEAQGDLRLAEGARCYLAEALLADGRLAEGLGEAERAAVALADVPTMRAVCGVTLARAARLCGDFARAALALDACHPASLPADVLAARVERLELAAATEDRAEWQRALAAAEEQLAAVVAGFSDDELHHFFDGVPEARLLRAASARYAPAVDV